MESVYANVETLSAAAGGGTWVVAVNGAIAHVERSVGY